MTGNSDLTAMHLQRLFRNLVAHNPIKQAVVAVESGDRSFRWFGAEGVTASGGAVFEDTPFFIASIDKLYNATIIMMLHETGKLNVDEPISTYLPPSITRGLNQYHGHDYSEKITVRHLLTHTSGIADWLEDYPKSGPSLFQSILEGGDRMLSIE